MSEPDIIWSNTVDGGTWKVQVSRTSEYEGQLTVVRAEDGLEIYSHKVGLVFGTLFGPDVDDVAAWQDMAITAIDSHNETNKEN